MVTVGPARRQDRGAGADLPLPHRCAVAAVTVRAGADDDNDALRQVAATAFASWAFQLAERLTTAGLTPGEAGDLAAMLIALLEGAHVMCRAAGTLQPFDQAAQAATVLAESRYPGQSAPKPPQGTPARSGS
jgi:transcriptional regulator LmrA/YxaF-like protein